MVSNKSQLGKWLGKFLENQIADREGAKMYIGNPPQGQPLTLSMDVEHILWRMFFYNSIQV